MRVEWKGGKLTKLRAAFLCWKMFKWIAENITQATMVAGECWRFKMEWPEWRRNSGNVGNLRQECAACEEANGCHACFLRDLWGESTHWACVNYKESPYKKFMEAHTVHTARKYARIIAEASRKKYIQFGGKV